MFKILFIIMTILPIFSVIAISEPQSTAYAGKDTEKELCENNDGNWEDGVCDFKTDDEDKADEFLDDVKKIEEFEEEKAALEDALCDDPKDSEQFDVCQSATLASAESDKEDENKYDKLKEICSNYGDGEWKDGECKITDIEEKGAYEDYVCDHPREGIPYEEIC